jgi:hypothetical protein
MAPSRMLHRGQVKNGWIDVTDYVGLCYPYFTVFLVLDPSVFSLLFESINRTLE